MTSIFSTISGQFGKAWILGAMIPVAVVTILGIVVVQPLLPEGWRRVESLGDLDAGNLVAFTVWVLIASGALFHLNIPLLEFYEGYHWRHGFIGRRRVRHYQAQFRARHARWRGMRTLIRALPADDPKRDIIQRHWEEIGRSRLMDMPGEEHLVLPTRLGNVVRSFEEYPRIQYGMDTIALWPRLLGIMDQSQAAAVEDEKISFDFMLNSSFLLSVLAYVTLAAGLPVFLPPGSSNPNPWPWLTAIVLFALFAWIFHFWAISRASGWGSAVRAAFDVHRGKLLVQLGYNVEVLTRPMERAMWNSISRQILYLDDPFGPAISTRARTFMQSVPANAKLEFMRSVIPAGDKTSITVTIRIASNEKRRPIKGVTLIDTIPDGFDFETDSGRRGLQFQQVIGTGPCQFVIGEMKPDEVVIITYRLVKWE